MPKQTAFLQQLLTQFRARNNRNPEQVVVAPVALLALGAKHQLPVMVEGVPVVCRLFEEGEVVDKNGTKMGVFVYNNRETNQAQIRACDLA